MKNLLIDSMFGGLPIWISLGIFALLLTVSCADYPPCEFADSEMVRSKISGEAGQVIQTHRANARLVRSGVQCLYDVRFQGYQVYTDSKVFSDDGPTSIQTLSTVKYMRPYELEHVK